ncbi:DUF1365 domain-containing protein [Brucella pseudogrignonensis]|uniref:DUF1365 domain-containing protein n=1 Tax=Brucella pseudogrignonensis TaxID=419475 RepID=A0A256G0D3_9HYPH|nr:DUF1365 family protein [Brucella pseudogrignonensis]OYR20450.1 hypothetical protein CEV34_5476 [Brucella pseudogrignonensis]
MTERFQSALFPGHVTHARLRPKVHKLAYKIYSLLLDLDELEALDGKLKLFSLDRFNLFSFYRKDRGDGSTVSLREQVERAMDAAGVTPDGGAIRLLTMPRIAGWAFNPLSVFFCYNRGGELVAILWEVDNTFRQRHGYMIPVENASSGRIVQSCDKAFYVSPFMDMKLLYEFEVTPPTDRLSIRINSFDDEGLLLTARHLARRVELSDAALLSAFFAIPFLTLKVVGGIHWEALKIWLKGIGLRKRPAAPDTPITSVRNETVQQRNKAA